MVPGETNEMIRELERLRAKNATLKETKSDNVSF